MTPSAKDFLADLYVLDPGLRGHEAELLPLIERLLKNDPATAPDPHFVATLRSQLKEHASVLSSPPIPALRNSTRSSEVGSSPSSFMEKFFYLFGGALATAIIIPLVYIGVIQKNPATGEPLFGYNVEETGDEAFGSLQGIAPGTPAPTNGRGGGGGVPDYAATPTAGTDPVAPTMAMESGNYAVADMKMIAPYPMIQYEYIFDGKLPELAPTVAVFKRQSTPASLPLSAIASRLNLGTLNLNSFAGMNVDSLSFTQNAPLGYQLYVNLRDSSINIDAQWDQWPQSTCTTEACYRQERLTPADIPADEQLIAIAREFTETHGIDLSHYGTPDVNHAWKLDYERTPDKTMAYVPETQQVTFPLLIDGKPVYDQSGNTTGIGVGVHVKQKKVMSVYGIMDRTYAKSDYTGVTDEAAIRTYLSTIDNYGPIAMDAAPGGTTVKKEKVVLGEPTVSFSLYYRYDNNKNEELVIPSLIFPVKSVEGSQTDYYYRTSIVVPLAADMLTQQDGGGVRPMMEDSVRMK